MIVWKQIVIEETKTNYEVNNIGEIRNKNTKRLLTQHIQNGYCYITLQINGKSKRISTHRVVALTFLEKIEGKNIVNHINGVKTDNRLENLEWSTPQENTQHAWDNGLAVSVVEKSVRQYDVEGNFIKEYDSIAKAEKETGTNQSKIVACCKLQRESTNNYQWRYSSENIKRLNKITQSSKPKKIAQVKDGKILNIYSSIRQAALAVGGTPSAISRVLSGTKQTKTHKGYEWKLVDDIVQGEQNLLANER